MSRQTFYNYRRRWMAEGPAGLVERSWRTRSSPGAVALAVEDEIVRWRKELPLDNGAQTIAYHPARQGLRQVPPVATIHRVLVRRGLVAPQPRKRPRSSWRRCWWPRPNDAWQTDATCWALADGREAWIIDLLNDHSRVLVAATGHRGAHGQGGLGGVGPRGRLGDTCSDHERQRAVFHRSPAGPGRGLERQLRQMGVQHLPSSPAGR